MFYAPCASRRRGHIFCRTPLPRPQFAPAPLVCIYKTLEIAFFSTKILGNIFWCYHNLYKFASAIGPFRADTSTSSRRMTAGSQEGILALSVLTRNVWKTFQSKEREEEIVCPFLCISMILVQPRLYLYHIRTQDGAVYFVHSFVPEVISRLPE